MKYYTLATIISSALSQSILNGIDLGECKEEPTMNFGTGFQGSANANEFRFEPQNKNTFSGQSTALDGNIIGRFLCDRVNDKCKAPQATQDLCKQKAIPAFSAAFKAADKGTAKNGGAADAWNAVWNVKTNFAAGGAGAGGAGATGATGADAGAGAGNSTGADAGGAGAGNGTPTAGGGAVTITVTETVCSAASTSVLAANGGGNKDGGNKDNNGGNNNGGNNNGGNNNGNVSPKEGSITSLVNNATGGAGGNSTDPSTLVVTPGSGSDGSAGGAGGAAGGAGGSAGSGSVTSQLKALVNQMQALLG